MNVEQTLLAIEKKAAMLRYLSSLASCAPEQPDQAVLEGISEICTDIEETVRQVITTLEVESLDLPLATPPPDAPQSLSSLPRRGP